MKGRTGSVINTWVRIILDTEVGKNVFVMLVMGMLSLMMGELKFSFPGIEGAESDFRTLIVFVSVLYFPRWYYLIAVSFIASLTTSAEGSLLITFLMHSVSSVFLFFCYKLLLTRIISIFSQALVWALLVVFSYLFIVFVILVAASASIGLIVSDSLMDTYFSTVSSGRYEIVVTSITSALVYYSREIRLQLFNSKEELLESKTRAEESDALKTSFLQNMSHEIRTPLNIISSGVHLLLQKKVNKEEAEVIEASVSENIDYMVELIDQVLEFSKLETGNIERDYERIPLRELLNSIMSSEEIAKRKNLKPQLKVESIADEAVVNKYLYSNIELIRRIVLILVRNAFKFTEEGSVTVLFSEPEESLLKIEVRDTGIGIAEEEIPKIFERFYQVDQYQKGVGLSLSFANRMIALLGGSIHIESELKVGTKVVVKLPDSLRNP